MIPTRQGAVLTAAAAAAVDVSAAAAAADVSAAAAAAAAGGTVEPIAVDDDAREAVKPTTADNAARGTMKPTAADDVDNTDGLCRCVCRDHHHHGLRDPLGPRRRAPGRCLAS